MNSLTRRSMLKVGGGVGLAGIVQKAAAAIGPVPSGGLAGLVPSQPYEGESMAQQSPGHDHPLRGLLDMLDERQDYRYHRMNRPVDPDLEAIRSMSPAIKQMVQFRRDHAMREYRAGLCKIIYEPSQVLGVTPPPSPLPSNCESSR